MTVPFDRSLPVRATARAGVLVIGTEILTGKVRDENGPFLATYLRRRGIRLLEQRIVEDDASAIGAALLGLVAQDLELVITTGGVGPTHDDCTLAAIAAALGRPLVRSPALEALLRGHFGPAITPYALRMADVPEGTVLRGQDGWPVVRVDLLRPSGQPSHVYVLPGIPALVERKMQLLGALAGELPSAPAPVLWTLDLQLDESHLVPYLDALVAASPQLQIGSYPDTSPTASRAGPPLVRVTIEGSGEAAAEVERAARELAARLPPGTTLAVQCDSGTAET